MSNDEPEPVLEAAEAHVLRAVLSAFQFLERSELGEFLAVVAGMVQEGTLNEFIQSTFALARQLRGDLDDETFAELLDYLYLRTLQDEVR